MPTSPPTLNQETIQLNIVNAPLRIVEEADLNKEENTGHLFSTQSAETDTNPAGPAPYQYREDSEEYSLVSGNRHNTVTQENLSQATPKKTHSLTQAALHQLSDTQASEKHDKLARATRYPYREDSEEDSEEENGNLPHPLDIPSAYTSTVFVPRTTSPTDEIVSSVSQEGFQCLEQERKRKAKAKADADCYDKAVIEVVYDGIVSSRALLDNRLKQPLKSLKILLDRGQVLTDNYCYILQKKRPTPIQERAVESIQKVQSNHLLIVENFEQLTEKTLALEAVLGKGRRGDYQLQKEIVALLDAISAVHEDRKKALDDAEGICNKLLPEAEYHAKLLLNLTAYIERLEGTEEIGEALINTYSYRFSELSDESHKAFSDEEEGKVQTAWPMFQKAYEACGEVCDTLIKVRETRDDLNTKIINKNVNSVFIEKVEELLTAVTSQHPERDKLIKEAEEQCKNLGSQSEYEKRIQKELDNSIEKLKTLHKEISSFLTGKYLYFFIRKIRKTSVSELYHDKNKSVWDALNKLTTMVKNDAVIIEHINKLKSKAKALDNTNARKTIPSVLINESIQLLQDINLLHNQNALIEAKEACYLWFSHKEYAAKKEAYRAKTKKIKTSDQTFDLRFGLEELLDQEVITIADALDKINSPIKYAEYFTKKALNESLAGSYTPFLIRRAGYCLKILKNIKEVNEILAKLPQLLSKQKELTTLYEELETQWNLVQATKDINNLYIFNGWTQALDQLRSILEKVGASAFTEFFPIHEYKEQEKDRFDNRKAILTIKRALAKLFGEDDARKNALLDKQSVYDPLHAIYNSMREKKPSRSAAISLEYHEECTLTQKGLKAFIIYLKSKNDTTLSPEQKQEKESHFAKILNWFRKIIKRLMQQGDVETVIEKTVSMFTNNQLGYFLDNETMILLASEIQSIRSAANQGGSTLSRRHTYGESEQVVNSEDRLHVKRQHTDSPHAQSDDQGSQVSSSTVPPPYDEQDEKVLEELLARLSKNLISEPSSAQGGAESSFPVHKNNTKEDWESDTAIDVYPATKNPHVFFMSSQGQSSDQSTFDQKRERRRYERQRSTLGTLFPTESLVSTPR